MPLCKFGKSIAEFQSMQFQLADMATQLSGPLLVYNAARLKDAGEPFTQQGAMARFCVADGRADHL